jgi:membrane-bound lytic murein transglycosylase D
MRFFAASLMVIGVAASYAQAPEVPHKIHFAGMSLTIRDDARREIQKDVDALTRHSSYFDMKAERAKTYFPIIEKIFEQENLPDDFKYLCLQESALTADAVSVSNAVGFWQFKDFTAQEMGLRVDKEVDERMNIVSSSRGAARYLKQANVYFNNWLLALQSYQMGAGGVKRSVGDKYNGDNHMEITSETYWYVKKYLAHKIAFENACQGTPKMKIALYETSETRLKDIARDVALDEDILREYNKWAKRGTVPGDKRYTVVLPAARTSHDFNSLVINSEKAGKAVPLTKGKRATDTRIQVNGVEAVKGGAGETIASLSLRLGIDVSRFIQYNDMAIDDKIVDGQFYFVKKKKKKNALPTYRTRLGDDLWSVSQQFGIRLKELKKINPELDDALLAAGTSIRLNHKALPDQSIDRKVANVAELSQDTFAWAAHPPVEPKLNTSKVIVRDTVVDKISVGAGMVENKSEIDECIYVVKNSDTLYSIARQFSVTIKELMDWNNKSALSVTPGEKLKIQKR